MMVERSGEWTLTEAARLLGQPQHRLIYLCEKGVVRPDFQDAEGRGSSRRFSARNLLEFAVALRLREFEIQASLIAAVIYVLRVFEGSVRRKFKGFQLPNSLRASQSPDLRAIISDKQRLYFSLSSGSGAPKVFGGIELAGFQLSDKKLSLGQQGLRIPEVRGSGGKVSDFGTPEGSRHARVEVSITRIAQDLLLDT